MSRMNSLLLGVVIILAIIGLLSIGLVSIDWPWTPGDLTSDSSTITYDEDAPPTVYEIEAIALDCRARIHAEVPVHGIREHRLAGQVYRTDTIDMVAYGDVDTCVRADEVEIIERTDGTFSVVVPAEAIEFVRPRVDAVRTMDSIEFNKGLVGSFTDVFPWVSDNSGLTPAAYAFAQVVIGGSDCMEQAYDMTQDVLSQAYQDQLVTQGGSPADIDVIISGMPDFTQNDPGEDAFEDFEFSTDTGPMCEVSPDAADQPEQTTPSSVSPDDDPT